MSAAASSLGEPVLRGPLAGGGTLADAIHRSADASGLPTGQILAVVVFMAFVVTGAGIVHLLSRGPDDRRDRQARKARGERMPLDAMEVTVGPWPFGSRPPDAGAVVTLLSGGPLPIQVGGRVRWVTNGESLRLKQLCSSGAKVQPLRQGAIWMTVGSSAAPVGRG